MSKHDKKKSRQKKKRKKELRSCEHKSDRRTAAFVARELEDIQERLCDLTADLRTFEHFNEMWSVNFCLTMIQRLKKKYKNFAEDGVWAASDC
jgi:hypothetical protein